MNSSDVDQLKSLHTAAVDARKGYEEALQDAGKTGLTKLFQEMISLHRNHSNELASVLTDSGETADTDGSFMGIVHRAVISIRSLFGGLDESVLPGLIDGEQRNVDHYNDALISTGAKNVRDLIVRQRGDIEAAIASMREKSPAT